LAREHKFLAEYNKTAAQHILGHIGIFAAFLALTKAKVCNVKGPQ